MSLNNCREPECEGSCENVVGTKCVLYNPDGEISKLECFLGINSGTPLSTILETLDTKLCNMFTVELGICATQKLGLKRFSDLKLAFSRVLDHICNFEDKYVKISETDDVPGYLYDKVVLGECLNKTILRDPAGRETLNISINFACLAGKIPQCIEIDCCGGNTPYTATRTGAFLKLCVPSPACLSQTVTFTKTYSGNTQLAANALRDADGNFNYEGQAFANLNADCSPCRNCTPVYVDAVPLNILCGEALNTFLGTTDRDTCTKYIKQSNQCNYITRWVPYTGLNSNGSSCPGCGCAPVWVDTVSSEIKCGQELNTLLSTTDRDVCKRYIKQSNQCNNNKRWVEHGSSGTNCVGCGCVPNSSFTCSPTSTQMTFKNSCDVIVGATSLNVPTFSCSSTSGLANVFVSRTDVAGFIPLDYTIQYAITKISGVTVVSPIYQTSNQFLGLADDKTYEITLKVTRSGQFCTLTRTIVVGTCSSCNQPVGTISISSSSLNVCGSNQITLTASSSNCNVVEWYRVSPSPGLLDVGTSIILTPSANSEYEARCFNCNSTPVVSNKVSVTYTSVCLETCNLDVRAVKDTENGSYTVHYDGAIPNTAYSLTTDDGATWTNLIGTQSEPVTAVGTHTYRVRKNNNFSCTEGVTFEVVGTCTLLKTISILS